MPSASGAIVRQNTALAPDANMVFKHPSGNALMGLLKSMQVHLVHKPHYHEWSCGSAIGDAWTGETKESSSGGSKEGAKPHLSQKDETSQEILL
jgi:hypothetical protein